MIRDITRHGYQLSVFKIGRPPCVLGRADVDVLTARIDALDKEQLRAALGLLALECRGFLPSMDAQVLGGAIEYGENYYAYMAQIRAEISAKVAARKAAAQAGIAQ